MPQIPKPGTYPSTKIQEGTHGPNDPALKNWDGTFGPRRCGRCKHFEQGKACVRGRMPEEKDEACFKHFETESFEPVP